MSPNSNFHQLSVYISSAVSCYRNLHQGFSFQCSRADDLAGECRNGFDMIQSQRLHSSFKLIISFTFSSLMFKSSESERLDKFSEVLVEF